MNERSILSHSGVILRTNPVYESSVIDQFVLNLMNIGSYYMDIDGIDAESMIELNSVVESQDGWIRAVSSIINNIAHDNNFGPSVISLLIDEFPLPARDSVMKIINIFGLSSQRAFEPKLNLNVNRNICVWLGCIAEKLIGANCVAIFTRDVMEYLLTLIAISRVPSVVLYALIALERFASTRDNKNLIKTWLNALHENPLLALESYANSDDYDWRQVGFCAQWALDHVFVVENRTPSYEVIDMSDINVLLNCCDMTEYLKISPDGLEARCDTYTFESVRCTFEINQGIWFYEVTIITPGIMQIGWATKHTAFSNHGGTRVGNNIHSISYDGCRRNILYNGNPSHVEGISQWQPGDVVGCLIDVEDKNVIFYINGQPLPPTREIFNIAESGFYATATFRSFQQCRFNFGSSPFKYPPNNWNFLIMNDYGLLTEEQKKVLPKRLQLANVTPDVEYDDRCLVCFDAPASCVLEPCAHRGFCSYCMSMIDQCPLCRAHVDEVHEEDI